jgi:hypothetical protein
VEESLAQGELGSCGESYLIPAYNLSCGAQRDPYLSYLFGRQEDLKLNVRFFRWRLIAHNEDALCADIPAEAFSMYLELGLMPAVSHRSTESKS